MTPPAQSNPSQLQRAVEDVLMQGRALLTQVGDRTYAVKVGDAGSLGAHYRHVLDHFICLLTGIRSGVINYDARERNPNLETYVEDARFATDMLLTELRSLESSKLAAPCTVAYTVGYGAEIEMVPSNVAREVMFCVGHAVHHFAIMKLLCEQIGIELQPNFGVAPSTVKYMQARAH